MPKARTGNSKVVLQSLSGGLNIIGIRINKDAKTYLDKGNNIPGESIMKVGSKEMVVRRQNGLVISGYERGKPSNYMSVDLRNETAKLLYRAEIESQGKLL